MKSFASLAAMALGLVITGCVAPATSSGQSGLVVDLPPPVALEGEPPIIVRKSEYFRNRVYYSQSFPDAGTVTTSAPEASIAQLHEVFEDRTEDLPAGTIPVTCMISPIGTIEFEGCFERGELARAAYQSLSLVRRYAAAPDLPTFRSLPADTASVTRSVDLTLEVPKITAPKVDLTSGPLVGPTLLELPIGKGALSGGYPSRALRREIEGLMRIECQIQTDYSIICTPLSFDPPEYFDLFYRAAKGAFRQVRAGPTLKDGSDASGVRFQTALNYRIN